MDQATADNNHECTRTPHTKQIEKEMTDNTQQLRQHIKMQKRLGAHTKKTTDKHETTMTNTPKLEKNKDFAHTTCERRPTNTAQNTINSVTKIVGEKKRMLHFPLRKLNPDDAKALVDPRKNGHISFET